MRQTAKAPTHLNGQPANIGHHRIRSIRITGGFLDGVAFDLADGLNCLIGARGTGKTTVLELVRYALDAMPKDGPARRQVEALVESNLAGGRIEVAIQNRDGLDYIVSRSTAEPPVVLDANRRPTDIDLRSGGLFNVDIFSQNEVEAVADQSGSQLNLIDNFQAAQIAAIENRIRLLVADLDTNASNIVPVRQKIDAVLEDLRALPEITEQLKAYVQQGGGGAKAINNAHEIKALRDRERRAAEVIRANLEEVNRSIQTIVGRIDDRLAGTITEEMLNGPNGQMIRTLGGALHSCGSDVDRLLQQALKRIQSECEAVSELAGRLDLVHKQQDMGFRELIERHREAQGKAAERSRLERARNDLKAKEQDKSQWAEQLQTLSESRASLLESLSELRDQRYEQRKAIVAQINAALSPSIQVSLVQYGNPMQYQQLLEDTLKGNRLQQRVVAGKIVNAFWPAELANIVKQRDAQALVDNAELNPDQANKVISVLAGSRALFDLETVDLADQPKIELNDNGTFKESTELSTGQKCTTILPILLLDSENPLLIDQPEDNLDNRFVFENIVSTIGVIKRRRQLIFVTHNPNIPVLGEADRVFVMDSDGTTARQLNAGSVDDCKKNIVTLLEGGADAFRRRGQRYAS
jgi:ABC-type lipoprotein export system ATPase subunit